MPYRLAFSPRGIRSPFSQRETADGSTSMPRAISLHESPAVSRMARALPDRNHLSSPSDLHNISAHKEDPSAILLPFCAILLAIVPQVWHT